MLEADIAAHGGDWASPGDYHHWPELWATQSLEAARTAYEGLVFGAETPDPKGGIKSIKIAFPAHYDENCIPLAKKRLSQAAFHLAELLNAIRWAD